MLHLRLIQTSCVLLITVALSGILDTTDARSLSQEDFFPSTFVKRNSWWSKKSVNNNNLQQLQTRIPEVQDDTQCNAALNVYKCYADYCVPEFVSCARSAPTDDLYQMCRVQHQMCASRCFESEAGGSSYN